MKTYNKLFIVVGLAVILCGCEMDYFPTDELTSEKVINDKKGLTYIMDGCYAVLKDQVEYLGYASGNDYCRHYFQMTEYPTDNICLCAPTTDALYQALSYTMTDDLKNVGTLWMLAYKVIGMCNTVIESGNKVGDCNQLMGEAYFMRAMMHLHMVTLFAKPYYTTLGGEQRGAVGVPLRIANDDSPVTRATVGQVYDQIEKDLLKAAELLSENSRGNAGYPCKATAYGLLSRVYLYEGQWEKVIDIVDNKLGMAGEAIAANLESNAAFGSYFANAKTSKETLFCIAHETTDNKGQGSLGSMYNAGTANDKGWGEVYPSNPLLYLYERYPSDARYTEYIIPQYHPNASDDQLYVYLPIPKPETDNSYRLTMAKPLSKNAKGYYFTDNGNHYIDTVRLDGGYEELHVTYDNTDCLVRVHKMMMTGSKDNNPQWFVLKFANQDGRPQLSSPVYLRWAEVLLNRAEAKAQLGNDADALADVNILRKRAGIPEEGWFNSVTDHGYTSAIDIVLDERRLELAFEGHRIFDMMRNSRNMDRRYPGANPWEIVPYNRDRLQYPIPFSEHSVSGIEQNPGY